MAEKRQGIFEKLARPSSRSPLFWWMLENHDRIVEASGVGRLRWRELCSEFAAMGVFDCGGRPPTEANARKTWQRVRAEKRRREAAAAARKNYPSRFPANLTGDSSAGVAPARAGAGAGAGAPAAKAPSLRPGRVGTAAAAPGAGGTAAKVLAAGVALLDGDLVEHPKDRRPVPYRVIGEGTLRALMEERGKDGGLTPRAVDLRLGWSAMVGRKQDRWMGNPLQGVVVLDDELIGVAFEGDGEGEGEGAGAEA